MNKETNPSILTTASKCTLYNMAFHPSCVLGGTLHSAQPTLIHCSPCRKFKSINNRRANILACISSSSDSKPSESIPAEKISADQDRPPSSSSAGEKAGDDELAPPPNTFYQAISQAQAAADAALGAGFNPIEVEFPPLPTAELESAAVGAYEVADANLRLALDFASRYADEGKKVVISFPDRIERDRAEEDLSPRDNIRLSCLRDSRPGWFIERLWTSPPVESAVLDEDDMFIVLGASCQELPDVERLVSCAGDRPVILFNLKLDSARGDLGLPAFPRRDLHFRFLSRVLPAYYLRTRSYSRSIRRPPYVVNYSGALFRVFPGPYQVLLDTSGGKYRRLTTFDERPPLGEVRDILTEGMNLEDDRKKDGNKSFLFRGYKSTTWWEDDRALQQSNNWRS